MAPLFRQNNKKYRPDTQREMRIDLVGFGEIKLVSESVFRLSGRQDTRP